MRGQQNIKNNWTSFPMPYYHRSASSVYQPPYHNCYHIPLPLFISHRTTTVTTFQSP